MQFGCLSLVPQEGEKSYLKNKVIWNNNWVIVVLLVIHQASHNVSTSRDVNGDWIRDG